MKNSWLIAALVPAFLVSGAFARAETAREAVAREETRLLPREDRRFLSEAAAASRYEIEAAKLALDKTTNVQVRELAQDALRYHSLAYAQLVKHAHYRGMAPPMLGGSERKTLSRIAKLTGTKFDRDYLQTVGVEGHRDYARLLERSAKEVKDPQLKAWVDAALPATLRQQALADSLLSTRVAAVKSPKAAPGAVRATPPAGNGLITVSGTR